MPRPLYSRDGKGTLVHDLPLEEPRIAQRYGLWIFKTWANAPTNPCPIERPRYFRHYSLSHLLSDDGFYWTPEHGYKKLRRGQMIVTTPGLIHNYGGEKATYVEDSLSFNGLLADKMLQSGVISPGVVELSDERVLSPIIEMARDQAEHSQISANFALLELLHSMWKKRFDGDGERYTRFDDLLAAILKDKGRWWTTEEMANHCGLKPSRFRDVFRLKTGMGPKEYVDQIRMDEACHLLECTDLSVGEIANRLGYLDPFHFSRRFKTLRGESPRHHRSRLVRTVSGE